MRARLVAVVAVLCVGGDAAAQGGYCDPLEAARLRAHLTEQAGNADTWNLAWRLTFTGAAIGTLAVGLADPFPSLREGLYASSGKATIGALARWILPLRIRVPAPTGESCSDLAALREEIRRVAKKERSLFYMGHVGGIAVNLAGAAYVWWRDSLGKGLLSIAVGYPVGLLSNYTMPRSTWQLHRELESARLTTMIVVPHDDGWVLTVGGTF